MYSTLSSKQVACYMPFISMVTALKLDLCPPGTNRGMGGGERERETGHCTG